MSNLTGRLMADAMAQLVISYFVAAGTVGGCVGAVVGTTFMGCTLVGSFIVGAGVGVGLGYGVPIAFEKICRMCGK